MANFFDQFDEPAGPPAPKAGGSNFFDQFDEPSAPAAEKPFLEKLGNFARKVYENPPPSIAAARDIIKGAPGAATELTYGADPQAAEQAAGTIAQGAGMGLGFRGLGGTGVAARPIAKPGTVPMPSMGALIPREAAPTSVAAQQAIEAAERGGYTLPKYAASEGTVIPQVAASAKNVPWAGQPITRTHDELLANMGRSAGEIAPGAGTAETAGRAAKSGLTDFIKTESKRGVDDAYKAVDALINPDVRVPLDNTAEAVAQLMAKRTNAMIPGRSQGVDLVFNAVQNPRGMNYAGTKDLRSYLGEKTDFQLAAEGISPAEKKLLYGALSKDLISSVREAGGPEAVSAWRKANTLASVAKIEQKKLAKILGTDSAAAPEAVFNKLTTFANSKSGADIGRLRLARRAMGPDAWSELAPVIIDGLGRAAPGEQFSPGRFVTAWNKMSGAAKNELFSGQQAAALSDLFIVSSHIQDRITRFGNPSGTARGSIIGQGITGGALFAEPISTIATLVGTRLAAEAMSRPAIVRAATSAARASLSGNPMASRRALEALRAAVQAEGLLPRSGQPALPQFAGAQMPFRPGEAEQNLMDSINGPQGYPDFRWVNPAGVDAFLASGPMSTNIEDRRDELGGFDAAAGKVRRRYPTR